MILVKEANLLDATEDFVVQQACCTACKPHGLSQVIALQWPWGNPYAKRVPMKKGGNTATEKTRDIPGTVGILGNGKDERFVVCLFAQYAMGKPGIYNSFGNPDSKQDRERYFKQCLEDLANLIPPNSSLALPYKIGCGLAGGDWSNYEKLLGEWVSKHPTLQVVLYKI
jgi:hypothetical protein